MSYTMGTKTLVGLGVVLVLLGCGGWAASRHAAPLLEREAWLAFEQKTLARMSELDTALVKAERGPAGPGSQGLERLTAAAQAVRDNLRELRAAAAGNPARQRQLDAFGDLIGRRLALLRETARRGGDPAADGAGAGGGRARSARLGGETRDVLARLRAGGGEALARWDERAAAGARNLLGVVDLANGVAFLLVALAVLMLRREVKGREQAQAALCQAHRRLEEQFRQAQKMEVIGLLAAGVAHDFNNVLTIILCCGEAARRRLPPGDPSRQFLDEIGRAGEQAAALARQLVAFGRQQAPQPEVVNLNAVVVELEGMLRRLLGKRVEVDTELDPTLGPVRAVPGELAQVLLNLVVNARDAMPDGGRLTLVTRRADSGPAGVGSGAAAGPGPWVVLSVRDTGCGMDAATRARAFEPFFTTKGSRGSGLGLATVWGIVRQCGGHVSVASEPGRGTTFTVYLPACPGRPQHREHHGGQRPAEGAAACPLSHCFGPVRGRQ